MSSKLKPFEMLPAALRAGVAPARTSVPTGVRPNLPTVARPTMPNMGPATRISTQPGKPSMAPRMATRPDQLFQRQEKPSVSSTLHQSMAWGLHPSVASQVKFPTNASMSVPEHLRADTGRLAQPGSPADGTPDLLRAGFKRANSEPAQSTNGGIPESLRPGARRASVPTHGHVPMPEPQPQTPQFVPYEASMPDPRRFQGARPTGVRPGGGKPPPSPHDQSQLQGNGWSQPQVPPQGRRYARPQAEIRNSQGYTGAFTNLHGPTASAASTRPPSQLHTGAVQSTPTLVSTTAPLSPTHTKPAASQPVKTKAVEEIHGDIEFGRAVQQMKQELLGTYKTKKGFLSRLSKEDKAHNARIAQCMKVLDSHMVGNRNFIIHIDGKPAGMMSMSVPPAGTPGDDGVKIHGLMSLPGTTGVGRRAVEKAVQMSIAEERKGRVHLEFLEFSNSHAIYHNWGFRSNGAWDSNSMVLSPPAATKFLQKSAGKSPGFVSTGT
jgi:hypothetical protein